MGWGGKRQSSGKLSLADVEVAEWWEWAAAIVDQGVLLSLGRSRDGGALSIAYVHNGQKGREWYASGDDFCEGMKDLASFLGIGGVEQHLRPTPSSPPEGRRKGSKPS